jgi:hypothetical protein
VLAAELSAVEDDIVRRLGEALGTLCSTEAVHQARRKVQSAVDSKKIQIFKDATHSHVVKTMAALDGESETWKQSQKSKLPIRSEELATACGAKERDLKGKLRSALHECKPPTLVGDKLEELTRKFRQLCETLEQQNSSKLADDAISSLKTEVEMRLAESLKNVRYQSTHIGPLGARLLAAESSKDDSCTVAPGDVCWGVEESGYIKVLEWKGSAVVYFPMKPEYFSKQASVMSESGASSLCADIQKSLVGECKKQLETCPREISDDAQRTLENSFVDISARFKKDHTVRLLKFVENSEVEVKKLAIEELQTKLVARLPLAVKESTEIVDGIKGTSTRAWKSLQVRNQQTSYRCPQQEAQRQPLRTSRGS